MGGVSAAISQQLRTFIEEQIPDDATNDEASEKHESMAERLIREQEEEKCVL